MKLFYFSTKQLLNLSKSMEICKYMNNKLLCFYCTFSASKDEIVIIVLAEGLKDEKQYNATQTNQGC